MARMHSRKKGKSGSKKPSKPVKLSWIRYTEKEIEQIREEEEKFEDEKGSKFLLSDFPCVFDDHCFLFYLKLSDNVI